jgi:uncharacterized membrane protein
MTSKQKTRSPALTLAAAAVFAALVFVATYLFVISIPATSGYFNLGETIIYIAALIFGPIAGALSGGIGAMTADAMLGYAQFAPGTLAIKGVEGLIVGFLYHKLQKRINSSLSATIAIAVGGLEMVAGYFIYEQLVLGYPFALALAEVPFNMVQMLVGLVIAVPIVHAVLRIFPQLKR